MLRSRSVPFSLFCARLRGAGLVLTLAVTVMLGCAGVPRHATWENASGSEQYERLMWETMHKGDWAEVQRHLAPGFIGVGPAGQLLDRQAWVDYWKQNLPPEYSIGELSVQPAGADMVVTYVMTLGPLPGGRPAATLRVISAWQQVKTGWILLSASCTPVTH